MITLVSYKHANQTISLKDKIKNLPNGIIEGIGRANFIKNKNKMVYFGFISGSEASIYLMQVSDILSDYKSYPTKTIFSLVQTSTE